MSFVPPAEVEKAVLTTESENMTAACTTAPRSITDQTAPHVGAPTPPSASLDKPALTVAEVAELSGYSRQTITRMFANERGVRTINRPETMHKRSYRSIRIPRHVYERVIGKITN